MSSSRLKIKFHLVYAILLWGFFSVHLLLMGYQLFFIVLKEIATYPIMQQNNNLLLMTEANTRICSSSRETCCTFSVPKTWPVKSPSLSTFSEKSKLLSYLPWHLCVFKVLMELLELQCKNTIDAKKHMTIWVLHSFDPSPTLPPIPHPCDDVPIMAPSSLNTAFLLLITITSICSQLWRFLVIPQNSAPNIYELFHKNCC